MKRINKEHTVWRVYDLYRFAKTNEMYFSNKLEKYRFRNTFLEIILAITTSSSVATLWFWKTSLGDQAWKILLVVSTIFAVLKPFLRYTDKI